MKKRILAVLMASVMAAGLLSACGSSDTAPADDGAAGSPEYVWKCALNSTEGDNAYDTAAAFKDKIEELTDGRVQVDLYGGAQLGSTTEVLEGMSVGVADIMCESVGTLAPFTPLANIDIMPYLYTGYDHFMDVWTGELGNEIKEAVGEAAGFKLVGATYRSPRIVTATKEMKTVEDFAGFKLRAPNLEGYIKVWQWMGAAPTPLAINETYTALQQGTVEGQENPMVDSLNYSFDEVCDYWIKTNHIYSCNLMIMDRAYFDSLPEDIQNAVVEAADYAGQVVSEAQQGREEVAEQELIDAGKTVIEVDNAAFAEHFKDYAATEFPDLADWVARIVAAG
ncbi:MAG: TRAP transporter substrate-binding protein [Ruminiclostridium sp.]|nr:TRAP transporter substrate-binding protein [Ruminiclostridium sp.]